MERYCYPLRQTNSFILLVCDHQVHFYLAFRHGLISCKHYLVEIEHIADIIGVIVNGTVVKEVAMDSIKKSHPDGLEDYFFTVMKGREAK
jgi:ABC-type Na+ transport system ATPase subunit NatA